MSANHPLLAAGITESLRALLRSHLSSTPHALAELQDLSGHLIALRLEPLGKCIYLCPTDLDIQILTEVSGDADVTISGNFGSYLRAMRNDSTTGLKASGLLISGNTDVAQSFQRLARALPIDWPRFLSRFLGARLSGLLLDFGRSGSAWTHDTLQALESDVSEYLREETRWLPDETETELFHDAVDRLRDDLERLTARVDRLQQVLVEDSAAPPSVSPA